MFGFISFGSGSSGNCYYLFNEQGGLFIDAGMSLKAIRKHSAAANLSLSPARFILVTHDHADHVKYVGVLSNEFGLPVYATPTVHEHIDRNYVVKHKVDKKLRRNVFIGEKFELLGMEITAIAVPHDSSENVGYKIDYEGVTFVLLTDVGHITPAIGELVGEANYLVIEANHEVEKLKQGRYPEALKRRILSDVGHLSNLECGQTIARCGTPKLKHVWLCHLSYDNNDPELARYTVEAVLREHGIVPGKDFELDILKRRSPSPVTMLVK